MDGQYAYLVCVQASSKETGEEQNNNKFYEMKENDDGTFTAVYGRVGIGNPATVNYPMSKWNSVYKQKTGKVRNGYIYKDITDLKAKKTTTTFKDVSDPYVYHLLSDLQGYSNQAIIQNYTVTSDQVTPAQIDEAQKILNDIADMLKHKVIRNNEIDDRLIELYAVIPRRMKKVQDFLLGTEGDKQEAKNILQREQDSVDTMRGQVSIQNTQVDKDEVTLEDVLGIKAAKVEDQTIIQKILDLMGNNSHQFVKAYEITKFNTQEAFDKQKNESTKHWTKLLWHGSRNENWLNILKTGLKIRPTCAVYTGSMFGDGLYFADKCQKSIGYTSLDGSYWAGGSANQAFLALFDVNTGMEYRIQKHTSECYSMNYTNLKRKGDYDSLFALGGIDLRNNEFIVYKDTQCTIKYIVEIN